MKKKYLVIICILFLTGCSLEYEINFDDQIIHEDINATFNGNIYELLSEEEGDSYYLEKEIVEKNIPALINEGDYYKKNIKVTNNKSKVSLSYDYSYDQLVNSYFINRCFENSYITNTEEYIYVSLNGSFYCYDKEDIKIQLSTNYNMLNHNANKYKDGKYIWNLKLTDEENDITFMILKEKKEVNEKTTVKKIISLMLSIIITIATIIIIIKRKKIQ